MKQRCIALMAAGFLTICATACGGSKEEEVDFTPKTPAPEGASDVMRPPESEGPPPQGS